MILNQHKVFMQKAQSARIQVLCFAADEANYKDYLK